MQFPNKLLCAFDIDIDRNANSIMGGATERCSRGQHSEVDLRCRTSAATLWFRCRSMEDVECSLDVLLCWFGRVRSGCPCGQRQRGLCEQRSCAESNGFEGSRFRGPSDRIDGLGNAIAVFKSRSRRDWLAAFHGLQHVPGLMGETLVPTERMLALDHRKNTRSLQVELLLEAWVRSFELGGLLERAHIW